MTAWSKRPAPYHRGLQYCHLARKNDEEAWRTADAVRRVLRFYPRMLTRLLDQIHSPRRTGLNNPDSRVLKTQETIFLAATGNVNLVPKRDAIATKKSEFADAV